MRTTQRLAGVLLVCFGCSEPASKQNSSPNNSNNAQNNGQNNGGSNNTTNENNTGSNNASFNNTIVGTDNTTNSGGVGDPCDDASSCEDGLRCQSSEERAWNFCGAPMEPECNDDQIGDSCGNCFTACAEDGACDDAQTCNGTYCIGPRTCAEEVVPPP